MKIEPPMQGPVCLRSLKQVALLALVMGAACELRRLDVRKGPQLNRQGLQLDFVATRMN